MLNAADVRQVNILVDVERTVIIKDNGVVDDDDDLVLPPCSRDQGTASNPEWGL